MAKGFKAYTVMPRDPKLRRKEGPTFYYVSLSRSKLLALELTISQQIPFSIFTETFESREAFESGAKGTLTYRHDFNGNCWNRKVEGQS